ncbi:hypothetical protein GCM10011385_03670 [Nitratireductor aestuarii]|uniref:Uncharacterized protein n=1 Tax=Nitratireductor aestuarii TaxID=1735103 RepID=A0A916REQ1_9HYPH|nr:hypothetical protein [Nitratireductor aestuarii]GGA53481.1 hypothetical protein GCM10011385_03670 [Nitratireductor aestuarii]
MLLGLAAAVAILGFMVGFRFRAPALLALTLVIVVGTFACVWLVDMTPSALLTRGLLLLIAEHAGYLAGLAASAALERRK